jgi:rod shape-determining protein MreD
MRVLPFIILAVICLVLQVAVAPALAVTSLRAAPQPLLILALFVALFARSDAAVLGCWTLGLMQDLASIGPIGAGALAYGLVGLAIVHVRSSVFRDHPLSHIFLALIFGFLANELLALRVAVADGFNNRLLVAEPLATAIYTALLAPCLMPLLNATRKLMQFPEK